jgi:hypothetical protein
MIGDPLLAASTARFLTGQQPSFDFQDLTPPLPHQRIRHARLGRIAVVSGLEQQPNGQSR